MRVAILVLDGVFDSGLSTLHDTLEVANALAGARTFEIERIAVRRRVTTGLGLAVPVAPRSRQRPDLVIVPGLAALSGDAIAARLARRDLPDACEQLNAWRAAGATIAAACSGVFVVAEAGLLAGKRATTTWWLAPTFRARYPEVELDESRMIVDARGVITAGAALAHLDLAVFLIARTSPQLARTTAHHLAHDPRTSQAQFVLQEFVAHGDPMVEKFEAWAKGHLAQFSLSGAARAVGAGERTLERRLQRVLGKSPVAFVRELRVQYAIDRLRRTDASVDDVATAVGYRDAVTLRTLIRKVTGRGVRELRR